MLESKGAQARSSVYQVYRGSSNVCCCSYHSSNFQFFTNACDISWRPIIHSLHYIGQTGRRLCQRLSEHKRAVRAADFNSYALAEHAWSPSHPVDWENTCVLSSSPDYHSKMIQEAIHIRSTNHTLNRDTGNLPPVYDNLVDSTC